MAHQTNLFEAFGGIRPMADALSEPPSTVNSWKVAGRVPASKQPHVLARAAEVGLDVTPEDVIFPLRVRERGPDHADTDTACAAASSAGIGGDFSPMEAANG